MFLLLAKIVIAKSVKNCLVLTMYALLMKSKFATFPKKLSSMIRDREKFMWRILFSTTFHSYIFWNENELSNQVGKKQN